LSRPGRLGAVYAAKFRAEFALQLAYRGAIVIWMLGLLLEPIVYLVVWTTVARSQGGAVGGFAIGDFAAYFTILMIVNQLTFTWHFFFFEWRVRNGFFSPVLLRPVHPIHNDVAENLTFKALTFTVVGPVAIILVLAFGATFRTETWQALAFIPALGLAMVLRFIVEWTLAMAAFWITRTQALNEAYFVAMLFLSGQVAPLVLFPQVVQTIAFLLPFRWMISFPVETALGRLGPADVAVGYMAQLAWIGIALLVLRTAWRGGIRRYSAVGA
jgi:ABC-2 type transport system permease protein